MKPDHTVQLRDRGMLVIASTLGAAISFWLHWGVAWRSYCKVEYKSGLGIDLVVMGLVTLSICVLNVSAVLVSLWRRKWRVASIAAATATALSIFWPYIADVLCPCDTMALRAARELVASNEFAELVQLYPVALGESGLFLAADNASSRLDRTQGDGRESRRGTPEQQIDKHEAPGAFGSSGVDSTRPLTEFRDLRADLEKMKRIMRALRVASIWKEGRCYVIEWDGPLYLSSSGVLVCQSESEVDARIILNEIFYGRGIAVCSKIASGSYYYRKL